jgi:four helix bundle protein
LAKITIAAKEYSETMYWLERLKNAEHIDAKAFESMTKDCSELGIMLTATIKTTKFNLKN